MNILLIGSRGNMGSRYAAILNHFGLHFDGVDINDFINVNKHYDRIIIATPTDTHIEMLRYCKTHFKKTPILCEKPISTYIHEIKDFDFKDVYMVNNYVFMLQMNPIRVSTDPITHYDYFKTGSDGLAWDCIQIINLAEGKITLGCTSPKWQPIINGLQLTPNMIDQSYLEMVWDFTHGMRYQWGEDEIKQAHQKVMEYQQCQK